MKLSSYLLPAVVGLTSIAHGAAIEATDKSLKELLDNGVPTMLDIYASWCGHCKRLAPVWDELADEFEHAKDKVQIVKIDGDKHSKASKKFKVEYFPTLKFIDANGNVQDIEDRQLEPLIEFVHKNTKARSKSHAVKAAGPVVVELSDANFDKTIKDKPALVAFTATWCGHCKNMKPAYEKAAGIFVRDEVIIGQVDCTGEAASKLMEKYDIKSFPTIMYFPGGGQEPQEYSGGRAVNDFVDYVNEKAGLFRDVSGSLNEMAGRVPSLDEVVSEIIESGEAGAKTAADKVQAGISKLASESKDLGKLYSRYADKYAKNGAEYVDKEIARLTKLLSNDQVAPQKVDELQTKLNVLRVFKGEGQKDEGKDEL